MEYRAMLDILKEIKTALEDTRLIDIYRVQENIWVLRFERSDLFISLKGPFAGFHLTQLPWKGKRISSSFQKIIGQTLTSISLINEDRILALNFSHQDPLIFELFPHGKLYNTRNYHPPVKRGAPISLILNPRREPLFIDKAGGSDSKLEEKSTTSKTDSSGSSDISPMTSQQRDAQILTQLQHQFLQKWTQKMMKKCAYFEKEIEEGKKWQQKMHEAELLQAYFFRLKKGMKSIDLEDWENGGSICTLSLDPEQEPRECVQEAFKNARKLKRKCEIAQQLFIKARQEMQTPPTFVFPENREKKKSSPALPFREFLTESGMKILVGKKDKDNDTLTFKWTNGSDLWFHAADVPGSHVVLKVHKKQVPDESAIQDALQLALYFSKERGEIGDVIMAYCKHLSKPKGAKAGLVHVSHHKKIHVRPDHLRLHRLLITRESGSPHRGQFRSNQN